MNIYRKLFDLLKAWDDGYCVSSDDGSNVERALLAIASSILQLDTLTMDDALAVAEQLAIDSEGDGHVVVDRAVLRQLADVAHDGHAGITPNDVAEYSQSKCSTIASVVDEILSKNFVRMDGVK